MKLRKILWVTAALFLAAVSSLAPVSARASGSSRGGCLVGDSWFMPNQPLSAGSRGGKFGMNLSCQGSDADDNGSWTSIGASFSENASDFPGNCVGESGTGSFTGGGRAPNGAAGDGIVTGGTFSYTRVATHLHLVGSIDTQDSVGATESHQFTAELEIYSVPLGEICVSDVSDSLAGVFTTSE